MYACECPKVFRTPSVAHFNLKACTFMILHDKRAACDHGNEGNCANETCMSKVQSDPSNSARKQHFIAPNGALSDESQPGVRTTTSTRSTTWLKTHTHTKSLENIRTD